MALIGAVRGLTIIGEPMLNTAFININVIICAEICWSSTRQSRNFIDNVSNGL